MFRSRTDVQQQTAGDANWIVIAFRHTPPYSVLNQPKRKEKETNAKEKNPSAVK
jgi:hypothetical protein